MDITRDAELLAYLATACWADAEEDDNWMPTDVSPGSIAMARRDLELFGTAARIAGIDLNQPDTQWCHDFWLTRNGHGAGFWDGDWDHLPDDGAQKLTDLAHAFGELDCCRGDDGKIYLGSNW